MKTNKRFSITRMLILLFIFIAIMLIPVVIYEINDIYKDYKARRFCNASVEKGLGCPDGCVVECSSRLSGSDSGCAPVCVPKYSPH